MDYLEEYKKWCEGDAFDEETKAEFDVIMAQAQVVADKYMANAVATLGTE